MVIFSGWLQFLGCCLAGFYQLFMEVSAGTSQRQLVSSFLAWVETSCVQVDAHDHPHKASEQVTAYAGTHGLAIHVDHVEKEKM